jgi:uridylate kinase
MIDDKRIVLKIGGSTLFDQDLNINFKFLEKVKKWYWANIDSLEKLVLVTGGGALSRKLQGKIGDTIKEEKSVHEIFMFVTQTNAALLQGIIGDSKAYLPRRLGDAYEFLVEDNEKVLISGGLKVGWSTDMDAAIFADILGTKLVYKFSDIDHIYDQDPDINSDAKPIEDITWGKYFELFHINKGDSHIPNRSMPIDVACAQFCAQKRISFFVCGGKYLGSNKSIEDIVTNGTLVH